MIKRFLAAYRLARQSDQYFDAADTQGFWTQENTSEAQIFFTKETGVKLRMLIRNKAFTNAVTACGEEVTNGDYQRGLARGALLVLLMIEKDFLPPASGANDANSDTEEDEQDLSPVPAI